MLWVGSPTDLPELLPYDIFCLCPAENKCLSLQAFLRNAIFILVTSGLRVHITSFIMKGKEGKSKLALEPHLKV